MVRVSEVRKTGEMRAAIDGIDVIGKTENGFRIGIVVLEADFHGTPSRSASM